MLKLIRHILCLLHVWATLLALALGLDIPSHLPDGVYEVSFELKTKGKQFTLAEYDMAEYMNINVTAKYNDDRLSMPISLAQCPHPGLEGIDFAHMEIAREMLGTWCEMYNPHVGSVVVAVYGNATWYVCEWNNPPAEGDDIRTCSRREIDLTARKLDQWCGRRIGGFVQMEEWGLDYGRALRGAPICPQLERHDRQYDHTIPVHQKHRLYTVNGSGLDKGDMKKVSKHGNGKQGLHDLNKTRWRGPKGGSKGTSRGRPKGKGKWRGPNKGGYPEPPPLVDP